MKQTFADKVAAAESLSKKPIEVSDKHHYWNKKLEGYQVMKSFMRAEKKSYLHYGTSADEDEAKAMSIRMCEIINTEIRRRARRKKT